jgi:hypothetical protein
MLADNISTRLLNKRFEKMKSSTYVQDVISARFNVNPENNHNPFYAVTDITNINERYDAYKLINGLVFAKNKLKKLVLQKMISAKVAKCQKISHI